MKIFVIIWIANIIIIKQNKHLHRVCVYDVHTLVLVVSTRYIASAASMIFSALNIKRLKAARKLLTFAQVRERERASEQIEKNLESKI